MCDRLCTIQSSATRVHDLYHEQGFKPFSFTYSHRNSGRLPITFSYIATTRCFYSKRCTPIIHVPYLLDTHTKSPQTRHPTSIRKCSLYILQSIPTSLPDPISKEVKQKRHRHKRRAHNPQNRACPSRAQTLIDWPRKNYARCARSTAQEVVTRQDRCCELGVRIREVVED